MSITSIIRPIVCVIVCFAIHEGMSAEPIRLTLDESDQVVSKEDVVPVPYNQAIQPRPYRPYSLSLTADGEPAPWRGVRQASAEAPPSPPPKFESDVQVRPPEGAKIVEPTTNGPLRIFRIRDETIKNPAAAKGTSPLEEQPLPAEPASSLDVKEVESEPAPRSRYSESPVIVVSPTSPMPEQSDLQVKSNPPANPAATPETAPGPVAGFNLRNTASALSVWQISPKKTTIAEIDAQWGQPIQERRIDDQRRVRVYENRGEFAKVEIGLDGDQVISLYMIPANPIPRNLLIERLQLTDVTPAEVHDNTGRLMGVIYPERGVLLPMESTTKSDQIDRIIIQAPSAEAFVIRARDRSPLDLRDRLADYQLAIAQEPHNADAWYEMSLILHRLGREKEAFDAAREATSGIGSLPEHRLHRSLLSATQGNLASAIQSTKEIAEDTGVPAHVQAKAQCQWGSLLQMAGPVKNQEAVQHHVRAIELASPLVNDTNQQTRRDAKRVLVDAHMALAIDIAAGDWERKPEVVNQWLQRARVYIDDLVTNENATGQLRMNWLTCSLMAHSFYNAPFDPTESVDLILGQYRELVQKSNDPFFHRALEWETGQALSQAVFIEHAREKYDAALELADQAQTFLKGGMVGREVTIADHLLLGNLYFRAGAICAVQKQNHANAVQWYEMAVRHVTDPSMPNIMLDRRGESLVSMGVSYWSTGDRPRGVALTEQGKSFIETAIAQDPTLEAKLIVPLDNLAEMYREMGNAQKSAEYTASSKRIQQSISTGQVSR
ncbi:hypothetical protein GC197_13160 [bacterium]|nr:hypothetical protein [bacterium]